MLRMPPAQYSGALVGKNGKWIPHPYLRCISRMLQVANETVDLLAISRSDNKGKSGNNNKKYNHVTNSMSYRAICVSLKFSSFSRNYDIDSECTPIAILLMYLTFIHLIRTAKKLAQHGSSLCLKMAKPNLPKRIRHQQKCNQQMDEAQIKLELC